MRNTHKLIKKSYNYNKKIKIHCLVLSAILLSLTGCSSAKLNHAWEKTKEASYVAASDPLTWGSAAAAGVLYASYDDDITQHFMKKNLIDSEADEPLRIINGVTLYTTALFVQSDTDKKRAQRLATDFAGSSAARWTTSALARNIQKETPAGTDDYALGSHHALDPFANSALTRRNVKEMSIPTWGKYSFNALSYLSASGSAFSRVQEGGHSFADQLVSVSIGNFIGLFFYEAFLSQEKNLNVSLNKDFISVKTAWSF